MKEEIAVLAGGCFWGMEYLFSKLEGVISCEAGYCGGNKENPSYQDVKTGETGHAESVKIIFDCEKITYGAILDYFFKIHDPTTVNRQMGDVGTQYRSEIFYLNESQRKEALEAVKRAQENWDDKIVTAITPFKIFWKAEEYHQKYLNKNPGGYICHFERKFQK
ncbi:MAG: peptide-methionine (S)-S-oxide reductase MsrA [Elusimicrobia bacterium]|nr:peptide-methionine (S)-S-oxide reductase MsrA [Elusimicrobiota bacterium]